MALLKDREHLFKFFYHNFIKQVCIYLLLSARPWAKFWGDIKMNEPSLCLQGGHHFPGGHWWVKILEWLEANQKLRDVENFWVWTIMCLVSSIYPAYLNWCKCNFEKGSGLNTFYLIFLQLFNFEYLMCEVFMDPMPQFSYHQLPFYNNTMHLISIYAPPSLT